MAKWTEEQKAEAKAKAAAKKAAEQKPASACPVTDEPCKKDCAADSCDAHVPSEPVIKSSSNESGIANHPKFDKYKTSGGQPT